MISIPFKVLVGTRVCQALLALLTHSANLSLWKPFSWFSCSKTYLLLIALVLILFACVCVWLCFITHPFILFYFIGHMACGIPVSQLGIEPASPAVEAWSLNHWTAREVLPLLF